MTRTRGALRHDDGASSVEYGLLIVAIAAVIVAVVYALGTATKGNFTNTCSAWESAAGTTGSC